MDKPNLYVIIRTPHSVVLECYVSSLRIPTETGLVGLRPNSESSVLAVEPGLIVARGDGHCWYAGTAGGLIHCTGSSVSIMTPIAVVGDQLTTVMEQLQSALATPSTEREARAMFGRLETSILRELQRNRPQRDYSASRRP